MQVYIFKTPTVKINCSNITQNFIKTVQRKINETLYQVFNLTFSATVNFVGFFRRLNKLFF